MTTHGTAATARTPSEWAETLPQYVRGVLARLDTTLTLSEAKAELANGLIERKRAWEAEQN
jgi:hypothetical protein